MACCLSGASFLRARRFIAPVILWFLMGGCAAPLQAQLAWLQKAPNCCRNFKELKYEKLSTEDFRDIVFREGSTAFNFETGKSFYAAFELPEFSSSYSISISTFPMPVSSGTSTILRPTIMFLNQEFSKTREGEDIPFRRGAANSMVKELFINDSNRNDRYLILYTHPHSPETFEIRTFSPVMVPIGTIAVPIDGTEHEYRLGNAVAGKISLVVKPYQPAVIGN